MAYKNKKKTKKSPKKNSKKSFISRTDASSEIFGLFLIVFGIISFISLFSDKMGLVGQLFYKTLSLIAGNANFLLPLMIIFWGVLYNIKSIQNVERYIISSFVIFICILIFLDGNKSVELTLVDRLNLSMEYMSITKSGGLVGALLGFFAYKLLGSLGTYITLSIIILLSIYFMFKSKWRFIIDSLIGIKNSTKQHREEKKLKTEAKIKKENLIIEKPKNLSIDKGSIEVEDVNNEFKNEDLIKDYRDKNSTNPEIVKVEYEGEYLIPPKELLEAAKNSFEVSNKEIMEKGKLIQKTMKNFGIDLKIVSINKGPVITCYEVQPQPGIKLSKIVGLSDNLSMALASPDIRIEAPIPGKSAVGIEVPNKLKEEVKLRELVDSKEFDNKKTSVPLCLGKDVEGNIMISAIDDMPHMLIAGATGSGKSVCINNIILSILYKSPPGEVKLLLVDPKVVELNIYNGISNLLIPVVTNPKKAAFALNWAVSEMEKRYEAFAENGVKDIKGYNRKAKERGLEYFPKIVIVVDELADLMMVAAGEVEDAIARLAQMARAAGMHLILATQRPSVDVITGTIKANIPSRIAFSVSSAIDSRTILDMAGAEKLLGKGDMLFYPSGYSKPKRIQGAYVSEEEVKRVVDFLKANNEIKDDNKKILDDIDRQIKKEVNDLDPLFKEAIEHILTDEQASISYLQRKLKIGYSRAARIIDQMEEMGIIGPHEGSKPRMLLKTRSEIEEIVGD